MSDLTISEKRKLEKFFDMSSGYVLNFSNRSFAELIATSTGRNIFDQRYNYSSGSKANRLRAFWTIESNPMVGALLQELLDYACEGVRTGKLTEECRKIVARLIQNTPATQPSANPHTDPTPRTDPKHHEHLTSALRDIMKLTPIPRGFAFEQFLDDAFAVFDLAPRKSFRLIGEQIDGSCYLANETYLVEAKWQDAQIGNRELQAFAGSVRTKSSWSRGLYVSYSGFTEDGLIAFGRGDATRIICLDGFELWQIMEHKLDFGAVLSLKTRRAAETGRAHIPVRELFQIT